MSGPDTLVSGGTGVLTLDDAVRAYLRVTRRQRGVLPVPIPGKKTAPASREGALTCPDEVYGEIRQEEFLRGRVTSETGMG